jgi:hypothetical protein
MSQWMRSYAQPMSPGMGPPMPSYIPTSPYGTPPYAEAAAKGRARMSTLARIAQLFAGAGQGLTGVRPGWGPAANFFGGFGQSYGAASASRRAAEEYAQKQMDAQAEANHRKVQDALLEAQTKALGKPEKQPPEFGPKPWYMALPEGDPTREAMIKKESYVKPEDSTSASEEVKLSGPALKMAAERYLEDGTLPPGMGKIASQNRAQILNTAASLYPGADVAGNVAGYQADRSALKQLTVNLESTTAFANTARDNAQILRQTLNSVPDFGGRYGNKVSRWMASQAGSPGMAQFHTALGVVTPEFARILQQGGISGQMLTDTARKDMSAVLGGDFTRQQLEGSLNVLFQDAENKKKNYSAQINSLRNRLRSKQFLMPQSAPSDSSDPLGIR